MSQKFALYKETTTPIFHYSAALSTPTFVDLATPL